MNLFKILPLALAVMSAGLFTACDDDDAVKTALEQPSVSQNGVSVSSLTFTWDAVDGANQYATTLYNEKDEVVEARVTTGTSETFTGLAAGTTYTLKVWAYGPYGGDKTTSPIAVLVASTDPIVQLATPNPVVDMTNSVVVRWDAIPSAEYYTYSYMLDESEVTGTLTNTELKLVGLPKGDYTVTIVAESDSEAFSASEPGSVTFTFSVMKLWEVTGLYYSACYQSSWEAKMEHYDDGSYVIKAWYEVDGYDLIFDVNADGTINVLNGGGLDAWGWYNIPIGVPGYNLPAYTMDGWSGFEGNQYGGYVFFYDGWSDKDSDDSYDTFSWEGVGGPTVEDLCGDYLASMTGWESTDSNKYSWTEFSYTYDLTITKVDDTTISLNDMYWTDLSLTGTVDFANKTITFPVQDWGWYVFCRDDAGDDLMINNPRSVVATFDDSFTISIPAWAATYYSRAYVFGYTTTLTKY